MTWLVTGGAGYIGAHVVRAFAGARACRAVVVDDLSSGHRGVRARGRAVRRGQHPRHRPAGLDAAASTRSTASSTWPASSTPASRSTARCTPTTRTSPARSACCGRWQDTGVDKVVFSSSAATYGTPDVDTVTEETADRARSRRTASRKLIGEWLLRDQARRHRAAAHVAALLQRRRLGHRRPLRHQPAQPLPARLRGAGRRPHAADQRRRLPDPRRHLRPRLRARRRPRRLARRGRPGAWRPATRSSRSTTSAAATASRCARSWTPMARVTGIDFDARDRPARPGDPARIVASGELAARDLDWRMRHTVDDMVASAWQARQAHA